MWVSLDFVTSPANFWSMARAMPYYWPGETDGEPMAECQFAPPEILGAVVHIMTANRYSRSDMEAVLGGNWLQVCKACLQGN